MVENTVQIAMASDDNYLNLLIVALTSIVLNSQSDIHCYILTTELSEDSCQKITKINSLNTPKFTFDIITISEDDFREFPTARRLTFMATARLELHNLIPSLDKILYLDCDIIVLKDIAECFNYQLNDKQLFAACMDYVSPQKSERIKVKYHDYFNSGVLLMNLKKMREIDFSSCSNDCLSNPELTIKNDQDLLNAVTNYTNLTWLRMAAKWNTFGDISFRKVKKTKLYNNEIYLIKAALANPSIIHYTGIKPLTYNYRARFNDIFWSYVQKSPIAELQLTDKNFKNFMLKHFFTPKLQRKIKSLTKRMKKNKK